MTYLMDLDLNLNWMELFTVSSSSFLLVFAAEMGDKSQLVCMALAARYRATPVLLGSILAFLGLNTLAVTFGVVLASWMPEFIVSASVAVLFLLFGILAMQIEAEDDDESMTIRSHGSIFLGTFLLITVAEFGDKTQLAVVALSSTSIPVAVWIGATLALITTSVLGVWAGRTVLQKLPMTLLHRVSGVIFILLAIFAAYKTYVNFNIETINSVLYL